jgi:gelsolin
MTEQLLSTSLSPLSLSQVEPSASFLNTNDVFVLKSPTAMFVWRGVGASEEEMAAAKHVVGFLGGSGSNVSEGKEPGKDSI